ncbi:hypothetical protein QYE76_021309 [Lolium multiflorum]|uniref:Transposase (putative) gypsy type domain-containing protein n=1 Tax=Lolium multiflorum TaxID=4521 RepID=A0AAD8R8S0_LOLMU|nr:hypothetical protein QYE76_021309 [Lolium multiflorum]
MAAKVQETENKKASKARNREGERGQWWPCETTDTELRELQNEGMISAHWSFIRDTVVPKPGAGEVVMTKAWVERGLSLPCSEFFLSVLNTYGLQPHNICPNSYPASNFLATLAEENLRTILRVPVSGDTAEEVPEDEEEEEELRKVAPRPAKRPRAKASGSDAGASGEASAKKPKYSDCHSDRQPRAYHKVPEEISGCRSSDPCSASHTAPPSSPPQADQSPPPAANTPPEIIPVSSEKVGGEDPKAKGPAQEEAQDQGEAEVTSSEKAGAGAGDVVVFPKNFGDPADLTSTPKAYATKFFKQLTEPEKWELEQDLLNAMLNNAWGKPDANTSEIQTSRRASASSSTSSSANKREHAEKQLAEKNSELIREKGEFLLKRNADSETIKRQQKELNGLRRYMETAEHHWDLLAENILEPLGYPEKRRNKFPRDDVLSLAGDDCKDLISASRKICHNLSLKRSRTCSLRKLIKRMDILPELVTDLQASSARGAAAMTLTMCLAHHPKMDLDRVSSGVPPTADVEKLLDAVSGYDTRIARKIRHEEFYDKVVLPADEPLEDELQKERDAEARPAESGSQYTWTSSKDAPEEEEPKTSAATSDEDEESDEDVSSPAEGAKGKDPGHASPSKAE